MRINFINLSLALLFSLFVNIEKSNAQAQKPSIMIFPSNNWMNAHGYQRVIPGKDLTVLEYQKALDNNRELNEVIKKISALMVTRGFPLTDLGQKLKEISLENALNTTDQNKQGEGVQLSDREKVLQSAHPDIILEVNWNLMQEGPKKYLTFTMSGIDAGTNKVIAGTPELRSLPTFNASIDALIEEAVVKGIDPFNVTLMDHFKDMFENGREISLFVETYASSPKKLNDEINDDGDQLKDDIIKWVKKNTVKSRYTISESGPNKIVFTQVRIPLFDAENSPFDAETFAKNLRVYLYKTYKLPGESEQIGLGKARVTVGGKRN